MPNPRALILGSGGGTRGALFPYIYDRLEQVTDIDGMVATSVQALHALAVCTRNTDKLWGIWQSIRGQQDFMRMDVNLANGMYSLGPMRKLMLDRHWGLPVRPMWVGVFFWAEAQHRIVSCMNRSLEDVIGWAIASSSIAGVHNVWQMDGRHVGDGGHHSGLPVPSRWWQDYEEVHVLVSQPDLPLPVLDEREVNGPFEQLLRYADANGHEAMKRSIRAVRRMAHRRPDIPFYLYRPKDWEHTGPTFEKNDKRLRELIDMRLKHGRWMWEHRERL